MIKLSSIWGFITFHAIRMMVLLKHWLKCLHDCVTYCHYIEMIEVHDYVKLLITCINLAFKERLYALTYKKKMESIECGFVPTENHEREEDKYGAIQKEMDLCWL